MPLRLRLTALLIALGVVLVASGLVVSAGVRRVDENRRLVTGVLQPASVQSRALLVSLVDQETGQRGYVLTGDDAFLEPYRQGNRDFVERLGQLREELAGEPVMGAALDDVAAAAEVWREVAARPEIEARREGDVRAAAELVSSGRGKAAFDQVRAEVDELQAMIDAQVLAAQRADENDLALFRAAVATSGGLIVLIAVVSALLLRRWALLPMLRLRARMRAVADGNLEDEVLVDGPPEVAAIGRDAESMRRRIVSELESARGATEALLQQSPVVAALGGELSFDAVGRQGSIEVSGSLLAAEGVLAGDTWEALARPDGTLAVVITDVSGHGAEAGLVAFGFKQRLGALLRTGLDLEEAFTVAAEWNGRDDERFLTSLVFTVDDGGRLTWVNAGHPPALVVSRRDRTLRAELGPTGPLVSSLASGWTVGRIDLAADDLVVACTDGVVEARNDADQEFGEAGLLGAVARVRRWTAAAVVDEVGGAVRRFASDVRRDDVTCVALRFTAARGA